MPQDDFDVIHSAQNMLHPSGCCGGMGTFPGDKNCPTVLTGCMTAYVTFPSMVSSMGALYLLCVLE